MKNIKALILVLFLIGQNCWAQFSAEVQFKIDSINTIIATNGVHDSSLASAYLELSNLLYISNPDTVLPICIKSQRIAEQALVELEDKKDVLSIRKSLLSSLAGALNNIGFIYKNRGDIPLAMEYYHKSLKIAETQGDKAGVTTAYNNIGFVHDAQGDTELALEYYHKALKMREEMGLKQGVANILGNIGFIHQNKGAYEKAHEYYSRALKIREDNDDKEGMGYSYNNIALLYDYQGKEEESLEYYYKALEIREEIGDKKGMANSYNNIGSVQLDQDNLVLAREYGEKGLELALEIGFPEVIEHSARVLKVVAVKEGNFKEALAMYEMYVYYSDSIKNEQTQKASIRQQTKYEFEKAQLVKDQREKEKRRKAKEVTQRRDNLQYSVILIALLVIGGLLSVIGRFSMPIRIVEGLIFFSFLILFEFLLVLADPYIETLSSGAPGIKLLFNAGIAAMIFPLHSLFENKLSARLTN